MRCDRLVEAARWMRKRHASSRSTMPTMPPHVVYGTCWTSTSHHVTCPSRPKRSSMRYGQQLRYMTVRSISCSHDRYRAHWLRPLPEAHGCSAGKGKKSPTLWGEASHGGVNWELNFVFSSAALAEKSQVTWDSFGEINLPSSQPMLSYRVGVGTNFDNGQLRIGLPGD